MKKLLSILLSVIIVMATLSCLMMIPANAATVKTEGNGYITKNSDGSYTAQPYFGNAFLGWYVKNEVVSTYPTYESRSDVVAKFSSSNIIKNGDFEQENLYDQYSLLHDGATMSIRDVPKGSSIVHGDKALYVTSDGDKLWNAMQYVLKIPVKLEKNTEYIFSFSYYMDGVRNGGGDTATPSTEDTPVATVVFHSSRNHVDAWTPSGVLKEWSYSWALETDANTAFTPEPNCYVGNSNLPMRVATSDTYGVEMNKWVDVCVKINTGDDETMFSATSNKSDFWFTVGNLNDNHKTFIDKSSNFYIDNIVIAKTTESDKSKNYITAGEGGKVEALSVYKAPAASYTYPTAYDYTTGGSFVDKPYSEVAQGKLKYASVASSLGTYKAVANSGYEFDGWYKNGKLISIKPTDSFYCEEYVEARFKQKGTATTPLAPVVSSVSGKVVVLEAIAGYEYSKDGTNWQKSAIFAELSPGTEYTFYQRAAKTDTSPASQASKGTTATTKGNAAQQPENSETVDSSDTTSEAVSSEEATDTQEQDVVLEVVEEGDGINPLYIWIAVGLLILAVVIIVVFIIVWKKSSK